MKVLQIYCILSVVAIPKLEIGNRGIKTILIKRGNTWSNSNESRIEAPTDIPIPDVGFNFEMICSDSDKEKCDSAE